MITTTEFGGATVQYELKHAILLYAGSDQNLAATTHTVANYNGRPTITAGQPITVAGLEKMIQSLGKSSGASFLPPNILSLGIERVVWWCPAGRRRIWFKPNNRFDDDLKTDEAATLKAILKLNSQYVHWPAFLFVGGRSLSAFALADNQRPQPSTRLYKAPCWNLSDGGMCTGNVKLPVPSPDNLAGFETAFFGSSFTHNSQGGKLTMHPRGHAGMWTELAARKTAPEAGYLKRNLIRDERTVNGIIKKYSED